MITKGIRPIAANPAELDRIRKYVRLAALLVPGASCLTQALALQSLAYDLGFLCDLEIGVRRTERKLQAHAWVLFDGKIILGGDEEYLNEFVPIAHFPMRQM